MASSSSHYIYRTPYGLLTLGSDGAALTVVAFGEQTLPTPLKPSELTNAASNQLQEYFAGKRTAFDLPLAPAGTDFQKRVWEAVQNIPYGQTRTARDIAQVLGEPQAFRAVGNAVRKNPLAILIPTHRVVGANGKPLATGESLRIQTACLQLEQHMQ